MSRVVDPGTVEAHASASEPWRGGLPREEILRWLREDNEQALEELWARANETRRLHVGDEVHLRGLIEVSNSCVRQCAYCGLRAGNKTLGRYRMTTDEVLDSARQAVAFGYGTVVLQAGESQELTSDWVRDVVRKIKASTGLAVTLSLGERTEEELAAWREAGADRYLLRFETSDPSLFRRIHPPAPGSQSCDRIALLRRLKALGYEVGSGIMLGLPGQTCESVAEDLALFRELDLDMIGIGPFIAHPGTPLGAERRLTQGSLEQVPNTELMVYKAVALTRLLRPDANIPSTTALATINRHNGRELGLQRGANVIMPNLTPLQYRRLYEIYPAKACVGETGDACNACLKVRLAGLGRTVGKGQGGRRDHLRHGGKSSAAMTAPGLLSQQRPSPGERDFSYE